MLSRKAANNGNQSDYLVHEQSSEPHMVVDCPCCQTKFAVESSLIATYETPKFHCSRCDAVFEFTHSKTTASSRETSHGTSSFVDSRDYSSGEDSHSASGSYSGNGSKLDSTPPTYDHQESTLRPSDFTLGNHDKVSSTSMPYPEKSVGRSLLGFTDGTTSPSTITREEFVARAEQLGIDSRKHLDVQSAPYPTEFSNIPNRGERDSFDISTLFDSPFSSDTQAAPLAKNLTDEPPHQLNREQVSDSNTPPSAGPAEITRQLKPEQVRQERNQAIITQSKARQEKGIKGKCTAIARKFSYKNRDLFRMSRPIAKAIGAILVLATLTRLMPMAMDSILGAIVPTALAGKQLQLPPTSLSVSNLTFEFLETRAGRLIPVVRGVVENNATESYSQVVIEAVGFNGRGVATTRIKAPLYSALHREKIEDLSLKAIRDFQTSLNSQHEVIKSGQSVPFTIALIPGITESNSAATLEASKELAFFSARIFSIGN